MKILKTFILILFYVKNISGNDNCELLNTNVANAMDSNLSPTAKPLFNENNTVRRPISQDVKFFCKDRSTGKNVQITRYNLSGGGKISIRKPFMFIIHGWRSISNTKTNEAIMQDVIRFIPNINVCVIDWRRLAYYEYKIAAQRNVYQVGSYIANMFKAWKLNLNLVTLVGQSLGAQVAGQVGKKLDGKLGRIFGLDPAGPLFCHPCPVHVSRRLDASDAKYVQVITTCKDQIGCGIKSGDATFLPNDGKVPQPACPIPQYEVGCSHRIVSDYFRFSLNPKIKYIGKSCKSCLNPKTDLMGYYAAGSLGNFYLTMKSAPPYV